MKQSIKKTLSIAIGLTLVLSFMFASTSLADGEGKDINYNTNIITRMLEMDQKSSFSINDGQLIQFEQKDVVEKAFQVREKKGDITKITTIIPYVINDEGSLVNSFDYAVKLAGTKSTSTVHTNFVDVAVTVITYYAHYFSYENFMHFYRHAGIEAYWSSDNPTLNPTYLLVRYDTCGDLYAYPDCLSEADPTCLQLDYFIRSSISKSNPAEGTLYIDGSHTMPYNRVIYCSDYFDHGGLIYLKLNYYVNGNYRSDDRSYYVYSK